MPELPDIFGKVLGEQQPEISQAKCQPQPQLQKLPSSLAFKASTPKSSPKSIVTSSELTHVLQAAMAHEPSMPKPKSKAQGKAAAKGKAKAKAKATPKAQAVALEKGKVNPGKKSEVEPSKKKKQQISQEATTTCGEYKPGEYQQAREQFIKDYIQTKQAEGEIVSKSMASDAFGTSMKRATLLCDVSLTELKRRRFVTKDCLVNPFKAMVVTAKQ